MPNFIGRVVDQKNQPIKDAKVSFEGLGTPFVNHTDTEEIFRFSIDIISGSVVNVNIRVKAEAYEPFNRYIDLSVVNTNIEEIRLIPTESPKRIPISIIVAIITAIATVTAAFIGNVQSVLNKESKPNNESPIPTTPSPNPSPIPTSTKTSSLDPTPQPNPNPKNPKTDYTVLEGLWDTTWQSIFATYQSGDILELIVKPGTSDKVSATGEYSGGNKKIKGEITPTKYNGQFIFQGTYEDLSVQNNSSPVPCTSGVFYLKIYLNKNLPPNFDGYTKYCPNEIEKKLQSPEWQVHKKTYDSHPDSRFHNVDWTKQMWWKGTKKN